MILADTGCSKGIPSASEKCPRVQDEHRSIVEATNFAYQNRLIEKNFSRRASETKMMNTLKGVSFSHRELGAPRIIFLRSGGAIPIK